MPDPTKQAPFGGPSRMEEMFDQLLEPFPATDATLHAKLDRIIALLEQQPQSTAILTGAAVREAMDELMRRNGR